MFSVNTNRPCAADDAGGAGGVAHQMVFSKLFTRNLFKILKPSGRKILGCKNFVRLHRRNKTGGAELRKLAACQRMVLKSVRPFFVELSEAFTVGNFRNLYAERSNGLELFIPENSADAASSRRSFIAENAGVANLVFAGRANDKLSVVRRELFLRFSRGKPPKLGRVIKGNVSVDDVDCNRRGRTSGKNNGVVTGALETQSEIASAV